jgi:hypothetical protein
VAGWGLRVVEVVVVVVVEVGGARGGGVLWLLMVLEEFGVVVRLERFVML